MRIRRLARKKKKQQRNEHAHMILYSRRELCVAVLLTFVICVSLNFLLNHHHPGLIFFAHTFLFLLQQKKSLHPFFKRTRICIFGSLKYNLNNCHIISRNVLKDCYVCNC